MERIGIGLRVSGSNGAELLNREIKWILLKGIKRSYAQFPNLKRGLRQEVVLISLYS